jgi:heme A synthase
MVMSLVNRFINFLLITLATPLFALIMIYVGWLYLSDMGSAENVTKAKKIFKNVVIGYVIALAAWLIVHTIVASLVPGTSSILEFFKKN